MTRILLSLAFFLLLPAFSAQAAKTSSAKAGDDKPLVFSYNAIDGSVVDLQSMRGQVVLIYFWATWSKPSRDDIPVIIRVRKKYKDSGFAVVGVSLDSDENAMKRYVDEYAMNWPEYFDGKGTNNSVAVSMGVKDIPSLWLIGKDGRVISINSNGNLDAAVQKALAVPYKAQ